MRVDFENITVTLGGRDVVTDASVTVQSGRVVGLVGPNGSGKSSCEPCTALSPRKREPYASTVAIFAPSADGRLLARYR